MTTAGPPPSDDVAGEAIGDTLSDARAAAARIAAADAARVAADVRTHEEHVARLQAEANARAADDARLAAEARVRELEGQLSALLDAQDAAEAAAAASYDEPPVDPNSLSLFDNPQPIDEPTRAGDGSDPTVLPKVLIGVAVVFGLFTLAAFFSGRPGLGLLMLAVTVGLLWYASTTWVAPIEISVSRGIVYIDQGESKHRFDLRNERTQVEMSGRPGDRDWEVRFLRRALDPFVVTASMIDDAEGFVSSLRQYRPDL
jgi:hypothetical protein